MYMRHTVHKLRELLEILSVRLYSVNRNVFAMCEFKYLLDSISIICAKINIYFI